MIILMKDNNQAIRWFGILGILAGIIAVSADIASGYSSNPSLMNTAISLSLESVAPLLASKPHWQLVLGHFLAIFFLPLEGLFIVSHTYFGLQSVGKVKSGIFWFIGIFTFAVGAAYHGTYGFVAEVIQAGDEILLSNIADYFEPLGLILTVIAILWATYWFLLILSGRSKYPRWMSLISPISLMVLSTLIVSILPASSYDIRTFITVTGLNMPMLIWVICSTIFLWNQQE